MNKSKIPKSYHASVWKLHLKVESLVNQVVAILHARNGNSIWPRNHENYPGSSARECWRDGSMKTRNHRCFFLTQIFFSFTHPKTLERLVLRRSGFFCCPKLISIWFYHHLLLFMKLERMCMDFWIGKHLMVIGNVTFSNNNSRPKNLLASSGPEWQIICHPLLWELGTPTSSAILKTVQGTSW